MTDEERRKKCRRRHRIQSFLTFLLLVAICVAIFIIDDRAEKQKIEQIREEVRTEMGDVLTGDELRSMMADNKYSPGLGDIYAQEHPTYAWLFDGSVVDYVDG